MIKAIAMAGFGFSLASFIFFYITKHNFFFKIAGLSIAIFIISIVTGNQLIVFFILAVLGVFLVKTEPENSLLYYFALLPVFPINVNWLFSAPGIDTLFDLNHARILILCFLAPICVKHIASEKSIVDPLSTYSGVVDRLLIIFILFTSYSFFRDANLLVACRLTLQLWIDVWIPYFAISRSLKQFNEVLIVFLYTAVALSIVSFLESISWFRIYDMITLPMGEGYIFPKIRNGALRAYATMSNPLALGFFYSLPLLVAYKMQNLIRSSLFFSLLLSAIVVVGILSSGSRSPILANIVGLGVLYWWQMGKPFVEKTAKFALAAAIIFLFWFFSGGVKYLLALDDDQATFIYRYELLLNSIHLVFKNPIFGVSPEVYLHDPILLRSLQGEGIIDLTNTYLLIALETGLIAMFAFLGVWVVLMRGLYRVEVPYGLAALLMSMCLVNVVMLFMTSPESFVFPYMWLLAAIVCSVIRFYSGISRPAL